MQTFAATDRLDSVAYHHWYVAGKPVSVRISREVVKAILRSQSRERSFFRRGAHEVGGILIGTAVNRGVIRVTIDGCLDVPTEHLFGPCYSLSESDKATFRETLEPYRYDGTMSSYAVGFYRTHRRKGLSLDGDDLLLMSEFFHDPGQIGLVVKPSIFRAKAACFIWEDGGLRSEESHLVFRIPWLKTYIAPDAVPAYPEEPPAEPDEPGLANARPEPSTSTADPEHAAAVQVAQFAVPEPELAEPNAAEPPQPETLPVPSAGARATGTPPPPPAAGHRRLTVRAADAPAAPESAAPPEFAPRVPDHASPTVKHLAAPSPDRGWAAPAAAGPQPRDEVESPESAAPPEFAPRAPDHASPTVKHLAAPSPDRGWAAPAAAGPQPRDEVEPDPHSDWPEPTVIVLDRVPEEARVPEPPEPAEPVAPQPRRARDRHRPSAPAGIQTAAFRPEPVAIPVRAVWASWWVQAPLVLCAMSAYALLGFYTAREVHSITRQQSARDPYAIALYVVDYGDNLHVNWDRESAPVTRAIGAVLEIVDGGQRRSLDLTAAQLRKGSVVYRRINPQVRFRLEISLGGHRTLAETWEAPAPANAGDATRQ